MRRSGAQVLLALAVALWGGSLAHAAPPDDFRLGVERFSSGDYALALQSFLEAQRGGMNSANLGYNLGATYYRLGRTDDALEQFGRLAADPQWGPLAHYNMGLIEESRGRAAAAVEHYQIAHQRAREARVKSLAAARLEALSAVPDTLPDGQAWTGLVALSGGHDDNVLLADSQSTLDPSNQADEFAEIILQAGRYLHGGYERGWRLDLGGYYRSHFTLDDYNYGVASMRLQHSRLLSSWYLESGGGLEFQATGSDYLTTVGSWRLQGLRVAGPLVLHLRNELSYFDPVAKYDFIGGWQNRTGIEVSRRWRTGRLRFGYELELNQRDDNALGAEFTSYSPQRHRVFTDLRGNLSPRLQLEGRIELRASRYADANIQLDADSVATAIKRRDDRIAGSLRLTYGRPSGWRWFADLQLSDNDSNLPQYAYDNRQIGAGVEVVF